MTQFKQVISGVPEGFIPFALAEIIKTEPHILFVAHTDNELQTVTHLFSIIAPHVRILSFPAWNTIPYDRSSPNHELESIRVKTLNILAQNSTSSEPTLVITTAPALMQKVPPVSFFKGKNLSLKVGDEVAQEKIQTFLTNCSFIKTEQVMEQGEYAVRGGILDIFPSGNKYPVRIDFFGDEVDSLSYFDVVTQKTIKKAHEVILSLTTEYTLSQESISLFRSEYRSLFGDVSSDPLYESVSSGIKAIGIEHWLPLFFEKMSFFTDYLKDFKIFYSPSVPKGIKDFSEQIQTYYQSRLEALENKTETIMPYRPIPPELFFASAEETDELLARFEATELSPFVIPNTPDMGGRISQSFAGLPAGKDVFNALAEYIDSSKEKIVIAVFSKSSLERIFNLLKERHILLHIAQNLNEALSKTPSILILEAEKGFKSPSFTLFSETDILGERLNKPSRYKKSKENFIEDISTLAEGDLVVHIAHGIGRYLGLKTITVDGISHDCLLIVYEGGDKLFIPVENLDMLSRYGSEDSGVSLDRLGSGAWEAKKEKTKKYLLEMAEGLIQIAAQRYACSVPAIFPPTGLYDEFCARFGYVETEDQLSSIQSVNADFAKGHPMERLVCGDVGFGKTEVALRAAFVAAMNGLQVAVVVPTTLLARQHFSTFEKRFKGMPVRLAQLSRLVSTKQKNETLKGLENGTIDIVVGTHALLSKNIRFNNLGLLIIDEEQHFGVAHKERLKELKTGLHVLTLTATPIPRTLQLSLTGVRDLSLITTPPVDRLAVSTFVMPFDSIIIKDALMREKMRGGQTFYVCPRISDMAPLLDRLRKIAPEIKIIVAHGQMPASQLEKIMTDFAEQKYDVLLATSIIESGLDMPWVNTMIVHRADNFGLAGLYQLRGRVGRGKVKAYTYLTVEPNKRLSLTAQKRLSIMQSLDSLGAGFTLASHDLDIRGAGNLLGHEQSGHIKEVGVELYQRMLEEAVASLKAQNGEDAPVVHDWSPQISLGFSVLLPEKYITDLGVRMSLYNRLAHFESNEDIDAFREEMTDRFGPIPSEAENLFASMRIKILCRQAFVERLEAGPKGMSISFYKNLFPNPAGLVQFITAQMGLAKLKPDKVIFTRPWADRTDRLHGITSVLEKLAKIAKE